MRIKRWLVGILLGCGALFAQNDPFVTKIVRVHGDPPRLQKLACSGIGVSCEASVALKALVLKGHSSMVGQVEQTIQELDSISPSPANSNSQKNVELTVYVIGGSNQAFVGAQDVTGGVLFPVVKQLRAVFPYGHYQLLGTMVVRSSLNRNAESSGMMGVQLNTGVQRQNDVPPTVYHIRFSPTLTNDGAGPLHLSDFEFDTRVPYISGILRGGPDKGGSIPYATTQFQEIDVGIKTNVDLQESQKVVVGKTNVSDSDSCFFLVLSAKLVP